MAVEALEATGVAAVLGETDAEVVAVLVIGEVRIFFFSAELILFKLENVHNCTKFLSPREPTYFPFSHFLLFLM